MRDITKKTTYLKFRWRPSKRSPLIPDTVDFDDYLLSYSARKLIINLRISVSGISNVYFIY